MIYVTRETCATSEKGGTAENGWFVWFIWIVWLNSTNQTNKINQTNQINPSRPSIFWARVWMEKQITW